MNKEDEKKIPVTVEQVRQFLKENQDPEYREFHSKLLPGTENIMGVRLPILRKFAKQLAAQAWKDWFEQQMTSGMRKPCCGDWLWHMPGWTVKNASNM